MKQVVIVILSLMIGIALGVMLIAFFSKGEGECKTETIGHVFEVGTNCHASD